MVTGRNLSPIAFYKIFIYWKLGSENLLKSWLKIDPKMMSKFAFINR
jgi:hypothetical protein